MTWWRSLVSAVVNEEGDKDDGVYCLRPLAWGFDAGGVKPEANNWFRRCRARYDMMDKHIDIHLQRHWRIGCMSHMLVHPLSAGARRLSVRYPWHVR